MTHRLGPPDPIPDRVHGSLYTDPAVFQAELEHIWYRTWVYVGHVSEVPEPNDYVRKSIGPQPVIMTRDRDGEIHLLLNRCTAPGQPGLRPPEREHAPRSAARTTAGRSPTPAPCSATRSAAATAGGSARPTSGLATVPRVEQIHGFVFGSFAPDGPTAAPSTSGRRPTPSTASCACRRPARSR